MTVHRSSTLSSTYPTLRKVFVFSHVYDSSGAHLPSLLPVLVVTQEQCGRVTARCPPSFQQPQEAVLQVLKCHCKDHSVGNQQHLIVLNCSPIYTCGTKNTTLYHANQRGIYTGCKKAVYLTVIKAVTHLPASQRCDASAQGLML